ncbi:MAG: MotA/TolQ/ExbB proton channel family protein [Candidatus Cloacimonetes bacterium]|nr:MotA/TolQ/ExbB proton channel family protein [Candidatus Cloacimonadota bacterium]
MKAKTIVLVILTLVISIGALSAQAAQAAPVTTDPVNLGTIFRDSNSQGYFGYLILLVFIVGIVYAIIRYVQLFHKERINAQNLYKSLKGYIKNDQIEEAIKITEKLKNTTLGFIFFSGLSVYKDVRRTATKEDLGDQVQNALDEAVLQKVYKLDAGLFWFDTLAQVCTYLGLLGTIWGLLAAFNALSSPDVLDSQKNIMLSAGIKTAIGTTALGLMAAIPLTLIKGWLMGRAQKLINEIDEYSVKLINHINISAKG